MFLYVILTGLFFVEAYRSLYPHNWKNMIEHIKVKTQQLSNNIQPILINLSYNSIYYYSYLQIKYQHCKPYINRLCTSIHNYLISKSLISPTNKLTFEIYEKGINIKNVLLPENNKIINNEELKWNHDYDLVILSDNSVGCINKIHYYNFPNIINHYTYTPSNIKFMSMELTYNNINYPIELKTDKYNHYIVNNKINSDFYKYYLNNNLNIQIEPNNNFFDYKVVVLDHNVNIIELTPNDELIIKENDYEIINKCENNNKLVEEETKEEEEKINEKEETVNILENINDISSEDYITLEIPK
jgi:hypothetical protein